MSYKHNYIINTYLNRYLQPESQEKKTVIINNRADIRGAEASASGVARRGTFTLHLNSAQAQRNLGLSRSEADRLRFALAVNTPRLS